MQINQPTDLVAHVAHVAHASVPLPVSNLQYEYMEEQRVNLRDYLHILVKRKWWFLGVLGFAILATALVTFLMTPIYKGQITLQIIQDNPSALMGGSNIDPLGALTGSSEMDRFYETQYKILQSPRLAYGIIDSLDLTQHPSYKKLEAANEGASPEIIQQKYAESLLHDLSIVPAKKSFLVDVVFKSTDKELAKKVPEAIQSEYLKISMATRQQSYIMIREWLDKELVRLGKKLEVSEQNVYTDGQKKDFLSIEDNQYNVIIQKYVDLGKTLALAQSDKIAKEAQYRQLSEKGLDTSIITNNPLIQQLRQQLISLENQVTGTGTLFGSKYPDQRADAAKVKDLRDRLDSEVKRLEASAQADYQMVSRTVALLQKEFDTQKAQVADFQNNLVQHHILVRDLQTNQALYEALLARMKEANVASTMVASNVSVITPAVTPHKPWMPKKGLFMTLGAFIGTVCGIMTAFFVQYLDNSIKNLEELEKICNISPLGMIPLVRHNGRAKQDQLQSLELSPFNNPMSMMSEAVFQVRTSIMLSTSGSPPRVITITSANPGEGKSTTASNIAVSLAGSDRRCLIMDCDLRKPRLHKVFQQSCKCGITNYLTGSATLRDIIKPTPVPNLYMIPAGPTPPNPNDLLISAAFRNLLDTLRKKFHHIILDSPPIIGFADARSLSAYADGTILIVRHLSTTREEGKLAAQLLSQNNFHILGGILTMTKKEGMGYGGYYGYYRYYNKYYKDYSKSSEKLLADPAA